MHMLFRGHNRPSPKVGQPGKSRTTIPFQSNKCLTSVETFDDPFVDDVPGPVVLVDLSGDVFADGHVDELAGVADRVQDGAQV